MNRYKGTIYAWDVVNEAILINLMNIYVHSKWLEICGEEYIAKAFQYAHEADPKAQLFYNDYNEITASKREKIYRLVKSLKDAGVPIHGLGLQGHWAVNEPSKAQLDSTLKRFSELGVKCRSPNWIFLFIQKNMNARQRRPEDADTTFTGAREQKQMEVYKYSFELFRKYKKYITSCYFLEYF